MILMTLFFKKLIDSLTPKIQSPTPLKPLLGRHPTLIGRGVRPDRSSPDQRRRDRINLTMPDKRDDAACLFPTERIDITRSGDFRRLTTIERPKIIAPDREISIDFDAPVTPNGQYWQGLEPRLNP
jgi:hypothetical protein